MIHPHHLPPSEARVPVCKVTDHFISSVIEMKGWGNNYYCQSVHVPTSDQPSRVRPIHISKVLGLSILYIEVVDRVFPGFRGQWMWVISTATSTYLPLLPTKVTIVTYIWTYCYLHWYLSSYHWGPRWTLWCSKKPPLLEGLTNYFRKLVWKA